MEQSGGELAAPPDDGEDRLEEPSNAGDGEDRLSGLPNDILVLILLRLDTAAAAARTSVLSRRWRRVWALLPGLRFPFSPDPHHIASALAAHEAVLRVLLVGTMDAAPESVAAVLRVAAPRLSGRLIFANRVSGTGRSADDDSEDDEEDAFELPCLEGATAINLDLGGFLGLALPLAGVFARLTELGDTVSSPRSPCLQKLRVRDVRRLFSLSVHSESLIQLDLQKVVGLQQLSIDAPGLKDLTLEQCFVENHPIANISAPELVTLCWRDVYDHSSMQLGKMAQLQLVFPNIVLVHGDGHHDSLNRSHNRNCLRFLQQFQFQVIHKLTISLGYLQGICNSQYLLEDITFLPRSAVLTVVVINRGHAFGAGLYHVLRLCSGIKRLFLSLDSDLEPQPACPSGCNCDEPTNWRTELLLLNCLQEVLIINLKRSEHEVAFVKQLFNWSTALKIMKITFDSSISRSTALELFQKFSRFSLPETHIQVYMDSDPGNKQSMYLFAAKVSSTAAGYCYVAAAKFGRDINKQKFTSRVCGRCKRPNLSFSGTDAGEDRLSALPDDILVLILLRLDTISEAARTSVLSPRWRRIWTLLPELTFNLAPDYHHIRQVLAAPEAPALRRIFVVTKDDSPDSVAAWLPLAARRLSGDLVYHSLVEGHEDDEEEVDGAIPLPCFGNATAIDLDLGFLTLSLPSSGAFTGLTDLCLKSVRFQGQCELGDVVSSPRCPGLRKLRVRDTRGLARLNVQSKSLLKIDLHYLNGLQQLSISAAVLKELELHCCFVLNQPVADISAPQLVSLKWNDAYDPCSVRLVNLGQLQWLSTYFMLTNLQQYDIHNRGILQLLHRFQSIDSLHIGLCYMKKIQNLPFLMEDRKVLGNVTFLTLSVINRAHSFGACSFDVLRLCAGIRKLLLIFQTSRYFEAQSTCPSGCFCDQPTNWKIEELSLNCLKEVGITRFRGVEDEVVFLKLLFKWAGMLEKMTITFDYSISKSKAKELCQKLPSFSKPETCVQFYMYQNCDRKSVHMLSLEGEGTGV
ncbi:hypothetical protein EJB05_13906, partial [Eragrostis curvula]